MEQPECSNTGHCKAHLSSLANHFHLPRPAAAIIRPVRHVGHHSYFPGPSEETVRGAVFLFVTEIQSFRWLRFGVVSRVWKQIHGGSTDYR